MRVRNDQGVPLGNIVTKMKIAHIYQPRDDVDLGAILIYSNASVFIFAMLFYSWNPLPSLVDGVTLALYFFLFVQLHCFLVFERCRRNPFILILAFVLVFFYFTRIVTLYWHDVESSSGVLLRLHDASVDEINHTLSFIFWANLAIFLGLIPYRSRSSSSVVPETPGTKLGKEKRAAGFLSLLIILAYSGVALPLAEGQIASRLLIILNFLLSEHHLFVIGLLVVMLPIKGQAEGSITKGRFWLAFLVSLLVLTLAMRTLMGSRAAVLLTVQIVFFATLATGGFRIKKRLFLPLFLMTLAAVPLFQLASYLRPIQLLAAQGEYIASAPELVGKFAAESGFARSDRVASLIPIFDRVAYLDFTADLIRNSEQYAQVVNVPHMLKSTLDGITPGFDIYDFPRAANALSLIYYGFQDRMSRVETTYYQSDQFNVYGEYFVLFGGWYSLPLFGIGAFAFQWAYSRLKFRSEFRATVASFFVLSLYMQWLISFGTDWQIIEALQGLAVFSFWVFVLEGKLAMKGADRASSNGQLPELQRVWESPPSRITTQIAKGTSA